jgi:two-component sensor histidine kinase
VEAKETHEDTRETIAQVIHKRRMDFETLQRTKQGEIRNVSVTAQLINVLGRSFYYCFWRDITGRKQAEERIQKLLNEKELIIKEVHHRIKNNMNTVFSLLRIEADSQDNPKTKGILQDSAGRVESMMVLYDKLYRSENISSLALKDYLPDLIKKIISIFPQRLSVRIETHIDDIILDEKILSPLGIIINELITNTMKYAFEGRTDGIITVIVQKTDSSVSVIFQDNGIGLPEAISLDNSTGFGMKLVRMLVEQIDGSVTIDREHGTRFSIRFEA